ncbi:MAG: RNA polymerase sigma factor [Gemmataceae bacterium]|nr:RNA polymerase sigma factor [Gemmataceae bacterium]
MATVSVWSVASDEQLLARWKRGDRQALDELFQRYRGVAYRVAYRLLGNEADALDAVQDAFVKTLTHLPNFQGRSSFKTWLLRVVSNSALDYGRKRGRHGLVRMDILGPQQREDMMPTVADESDRRLEQDELRRRLAAALGELPPAQRQTFVLHAEAELSYREVAEVLGISIGTVMSRLFYARQKLRALLGLGLTRK